MQLIEGLGFDKVHWCGHSTGGAMGQVLAIEHPARIEQMSALVASVRDAVKRGVRVSK